MMLVSWQQPAPALNCIFMSGVSSLKHLTTKNDGNVGFEGAKNGLFQKPDKSTCLYPQQKRLKVTRILDLNIINIFKIS